MTSALAWLQPRPLTPLTVAGRLEPGLSGAYYDGLVGPTGDGTALAVDLLAGAEGRAGALRELLPAGAALARTAAVWVHTGRLRPRRVDVVVDQDRRVQGVGTVHRQRLAPEDVIRVGGVPTTTQLRTAVDLLCFSDPATAVAGVRALLDCGLTAARVADALGTVRLLPVRRATELLARAAAPPKPCLGRRSGVATSRLGGKLRSVPP